MIYAHHHSNSVSCKPLEVLVPGPGPHILERIRASDGVARWLQFVVRVQGRIPHLGNIHGHAKDRGYNSRFPPCFTSVLAQRCIVSNPFPPLPPQLPPPPPVGGEEVLKAVFRKWENNVCTYPPTLTYPRILPKRTCHFSCPSILQRCCAMRQP